MQINEVKEAPGMNFGRLRFPLPFLFATLLLAAAPTPQEQAALNGISAESMRANLSYLASDALAGRNTPSPGLDKAAAFIAQQFRAAGLQPLAPDYLQTADLDTGADAPSDFRLTLSSGGEDLTLGPGDVSIRSPRPLNFKQAPVVEVRPGATLPNVKGKVAALDERDEASLPALRKAGPALILLMSRMRGVASTESGVPEIRIFNEEATEALDAGRPLALSLRLAAPVRGSAKSSNVVALLPGSDPALSRQYLVISAHYDHLGVKNGRVYNGANDNGSGVVSVLEIARALAALAPGPRRSIVFAMFCGEEEGLLGSKYYVAHPLVPLSSTIADINLEQMGRTDDNDGPEVGAFAFTGPSYSNLPGIMTDAARPRGIKVYRKRDADAYLDRSDNYPFNQAGIIAHTIVVAFEYRDYHAPGDKWEKIDYANMAKVDRAVAAGILEIANAADNPLRATMPGPRA